MAICIYRKIQNDVPYTKYMPLFFISGGLKDYEIYLIVGAVLVILVIIAIIVFVYYKRGKGTNQNNVVHVQEMATPAPTAAYIVYRQARPSGAATQGFIVY
jgi:uncharacterized membrane protein